MLLRLTCDFAYFCLFVYLCYNWAIAHTYLARLKSFQRRQLRIRIGSDLCFAINPVTLLEFHNESCL